VNRLRRLVSHPTGRWALLVIGLLVVAALIGPAITGCGVEQLDIIRLKNARPSWAHPFGTDAYSRDVLARVLCGARISLAVATLSVVLSTTLGTAYGLVAGFVGGRLDTAMMRLLDAFMSIPRILLLVAVLTLWRPSLAGLIVLIGTTGWFAVSRLVRADTVTARHTDYVDAARALGASDSRIMWRHVLPNISAVVIVTSTLAVGNVIALEAGLSYLGIGAQPPTPSWGAIFFDGMDEALAGNWWVILFPGIAIVATVLAFNLLGDALRDSLDPRQLHVARPLPGSTPLPPTTEPMKDA
jgi:peptide/nickel transport system permease protein